MTLLGCCASWFCKLRAKTSAWFEGKTRVAALWLGLEGIGTMSVEHSNELLALLGVYIPAVPRDVQLLCPGGSRRSIRESSQRTRNAASTSTDNDPGNFGRAEREVKAGGR